MATCRHRTAGASASLSCSLSMLPLAVCTLMLFHFCPFLGLYVCSMMCAPSACLFNVGRQWIFCPISIQLQVGPEHPPPLPYYTHSLKPCILYPALSSLLLAGGQKTNQHLLTHGSSGRYTENSGVKTKKTVWPKVRSCM